MASAVSYISSTYKINAPTITFTRSLINLVINLCFCAFVKVNPVGPYKEGRKFMWVILRGLFGGIQITCYFFAFTKVIARLWSILSYCVDSSRWCDNSHFHCSCVDWSFGYLDVERELGPVWRHRNYFMFRGCHFCSKALCHFPRSCILPSLRITCRERVLTSTMSASHSSDLSLHLLLTLLSARWDQLCLCLSSSTTFSCLPWLSTSSKLSISWRNSLGLIRIPH